MSKKYRIELLPAVRYVIVGSAYWAILPAFVLGVLAAGDGYQSVPLNLLMGGYLIPYAVLVLGPAGYAFYVSAAFKSGNHVHIDGLYEHNYPWIKSD